MKQQICELLMLFRGETPQEPLLTRTDVRPRAGSQVSTCRQGAMLHVYSTKTAEN